MKMPVQIMKNSNLPFLGYTSGAITSYNLNRDRNENEYLFRKTLMILNELELCICNDERIELQKIVEKLNIVFV